MLLILFLAFSCKYESYQRARELEEQDKLKDEVTHTSLRDDYYVTGDTLFDLPVVRFNFDIDKPLQVHAMHVALPKVMFDYRDGKIDLSLPTESFLAENIFFLSSDSVKAFYQKVSPTKQNRYYLVSDFQQN